MVWARAARERLKGPMPMPTRSCGWSGSWAGRSVIAGCRLPWGEGWGG